jgi:hypothetical protein
MKVTALLEHIKSNQSNYKGITNADINQIENQLRIAKELNPEAEELDFFLLQNMEAKNFQTLSKLLEAKAFFSKKLLAKLSQVTVDRLVHAEIVLKPPFSDFSKILFLKDGHFYRFLNQVKTPEIEEKLKSVLLFLNGIYREDSSSELTAKSFIAMNNYSSDDVELKELIRANKYATNVKPAPFVSKKNKYYLIYLVVFVFVVFRVVLFMKMIKPFENDRNDYEYHPETEYKSEPRKIDRYYTQMKFQIDSFFVFLADYKKEEIRQLKKIDTLKSGQNPFETFYQSMPANESNNFIKVTNDTGYDMVLLENATVYDTIKLPKAAYYILSGKTIEVTKRDTDATSVFNLYLGKQLASFQTDSKNIFIRSQSIIEYRFSELVPSARAILDTDYNINRDASVSLKNGLIKITY